jgi:hypothetical protein
MDLSPKEKARAAGEGPLMGLSGRQAQRVRSAPNRYIGELLTVVVAHDKAGVRFLDGPGWWDTEPRLVLMRPQFRAGIYWQLEAPSISKIGLR